MADVSIVIRTLNEERYLDELLTTISKQKRTDFSWEILLIDSGSTDKTLEIAGHHDCQVLKIPKSEFTFGRSLNIGCEAARGRFLVFISGHCIPAKEDWLTNIIKPLREGQATYCYGNQKGTKTTKFSEQQVFEKYFDPVKRTPQPDYFVNNANAALLADAWAQHPFDESITGLEDMHLAKRLVATGMLVGYADNATVYHIHDESWMQVKWRFEREAMALREIDPSLHMSRRDLVRCIYSSIAYDWQEAFRLRIFFKEWWKIMAFRTCQYWGSYVGSKASRKISEALKRRYFYPDAK